MVQVAMHVDIVPNRGSKPAALLRESYRQGRTVRKRTLANLSSLPMGQIEAIRRVLKGEQLVAVSDVFEIEQDGSAAHGHVQAVLAAMKRLDFANLLASRSSRQRDLVMAMVAARILVPRPPSKLATTRWWHSTTLPDILGVADADEDDLYQAMDWLLQRQPTIEKKLATRHLHNDDLALYDLSSSYFEGVTCPLAALGHNRDGKKGKLQVNYGLLTNREGIPVSVSVFDGNTNDTKTLLPQVTTVRDSFGIEHFVLVGDRGMIMQKQIDALQNIDGVDWITALRTDAIRKLVKGGQLQMGLFDERNLFEMDDHPDFIGQRLVACRNPELARRRANKRQSLLQATSEQLQKVQRLIEHGRLTGKQTIEQHLAKAVGSSKLRPYVHFDIRDDGFDVTFDSKAICVAATQSTVAELDRLQRRIEQGRLTGRLAIGQRISKATARRKVGQHVHVDVRDDGIDIRIDTQAVVAQVTAPLQRKLHQVQQRIERGKLYGKADIGVRIGRVIDKYKVAKHFVLDIRDNGFDFSIDKAKVAAEAALDGIYVVRTSLPQERMDSSQVVRSYKLLTQVEQAFRCIKTFDLMVRPIRHRLEDRVRGHILLSMLAYYVEWHMINAWRPLLFCDEDQAAKATRDPVAPAQRSAGALRKAAIKRLDDGSPVHSFETLIGNLAGIVRNTCRSLGSAPDGPTFHMTTPANPKQQRAFDLLKTIHV
jgi:transposase